MWLIVPAEPIDDDKSYVLGFMKSVFARVDVARAHRNEAAFPKPKFRPDIILNICGLRHPKAVEALGSLAGELNVPTSSEIGPAARCEDKRTYLEHFADMCPETRIVSILVQLEAVRDHFGGDVVVKDPLSSRGIGVERISSAKDLPLADAILKKGTLGIGELVVQRFLPGIADGDKRVLVQRTPQNNYEVIAYMNRLPSENGWKCNVRTGGRMVPTTLNEDEHAFALEAASRTGLDNASLDMVQSDGRTYLLEYNQHYGGLIDFDLHHGTRQVAKVAEFLDHLAQHGRV